MLAEQSCESSEFKVKLKLKSAEIGTSNETSYFSENNI